MSLVFFREGAITRADALIAFTTPRIACVGMRPGSLEPGDAETPTVSADRIPRVAIALTG
jgi:hypothetical protein